MNWTKLLMPILRSALVVCLLVANVASANSITDTDIDDFLEGLADGLLVVSNEVLTLDVSDEINLGGMIVKEGGVLTLAAGTRVFLGDGEFRIASGGTLIMSSGIGENDLGTKIHSGKDAEEKLIRKTLDFNGGILKILADGATPLEKNTLSAESIDLQLGVEGGTIDVEAEAIFEIGKITGGRTGDLRKTSDGTLRVMGTVNMGGNFTIEAGNVEFLETARIDGNFTLVTGTVEFGKNAFLYGNVTVGKREEEESVQTVPAMTFRNLAYISGNVTLESGTVEFLEFAKIDGNFIVQQDEDAEEDPRIGTVTFHGTADIGKTLDVQTGNVHLGGATVVGTLKIAAGTTISGTIMVKTEETDENEEFLWDTILRTPKLTVKNGGDVYGTLKQIGELVVGGGKLTLHGGESDLTHTIEKINIAKGATLDLKEGVLVQLTNKNTTGKYDDLVVEGTLRMSSATRGFEKRDDQSQPIHLTLAGDVTRVEYGDKWDITVNDYYYRVDSGILDIYQNPSDPNGVASDALHLPDLHTQVSGIGKINVASGMTFESGTMGIHPGASGAYVIVDGGGTYRAAEVNLGAGGYFKVQGRGTTVELRKTEAGGVGLKNDYVLAAGALVSEEGTRIQVGGHATFGWVDIAGIYEGHNNNLAIQSSSRITGRITGIKELTQGGDLLLAVDNTAVPTISTHTWTFLEPESTQIRTIAGTETGTYQKVLQIQNAESRADALALLHASQTALYRPTWTVDMEDNSYLNLDLTIRSVEDYLGEMWGGKGNNVDNVGKLIGALSVKYALLRERLEGLSDAQLQEILRRAMAGELAGNAFRFALQQPAPVVFRQLDTVTSLRSPFTSRGQVREGFNVWFTPFGQTEHAKGDGHTFDGYNLSRFGFHLGSDMELYNRAVAGAFFGYTNPNVKSDLGKISANDYTTGLYLRMPTVWEVFINMMIGFGSQDYVYKNVYGNSDFRGSSLFSSVELSKPIPLFYPLLGPKPIPPTFQLTPLVALDFQSAKMNGFVVRDPVLGGVFVNPEDISSAILRLGIRGEFERLRTRLQYMRYLTGDDTVHSQTGVTGDMSVVTRVRGTQWGKDWLSLGVGGELLSTRHWRIFADYNFEVGKRTTAHLGSLNTVLRW